MQIKILVPEAFNCHPALLLEGFLTPISDTEPPISDTELDKSGLETPLTIMLGDSWVTIECL